MASVDLLDADDSTSMSAMLSHWNDPLAVPEWSSRYSASPDDRLQGPPNTAMSQTDHERSAPTNKSKRSHDKSKTRRLVDLGEESEGSLQSPYEEDWNLLDPESGDSEDLHDWEIIERSMLDSSTSVVQVDESYQELLVSYVKKCSPTEAQIAKVKMAMAIAYFASQFGGGIAKDALKEWVDIAMKDSFDIDIDELPAQAASALDRLRRKVPLPARRLAV